MSLYKKFVLRGIAAGLVVAAGLFMGGILSTTKPVQASDTGDCGTSSIITCGVKNVQEIIDKYNAADAQGAVMKGTYGHFGIGSDQLNELNLHAVEGTVYNDFFGGHDVIVVNVNGVDKVVAVNARTAGRVNVAGSTTIGTFSGITTYERAYHLSNHSAKHVFVLMDGEKFLFGVIEECGNPIVGDTPALAFSKEISKDAVNYTENATFNDGETAYFRLNVSETTGKGIATGVTLSDVLPSGFEYVPGSTTIDGAAVADVTANNSIFFDQIAPGTNKTAGFQAKVHLVNQACGTSHIVNTASVDSDQLAPISDTASADVSKACPVVVGTCNSLAGPDALAEGEKGTYTVASTADNVGITAVVFSVDGTMVQSSLSTTYEYTAAAGTHTISAVVHFDNGTESGGAGCTKTVNVNPVPKTVSCVSVQFPASLQVNESATFTVVSSDASLVETYQFLLDGTKVGESASPTSSLAIGTAGAHTVSAAITAKAGATVTPSSTCQASVTVNELPKTVMCTGINGPAGLAVKEAGTFTALTDNDDRVASYAWTGTTSSNGKTATASFDKEGTYTVKVTITPKEGVTAGTPVTCDKTVTVTANPLYSCDLLTAVPQSVKAGEKVTVTVNYTASNGAAFKSAVVDFGEAKMDVASASGGVFKAEYTYKMAGTYNVTSTVTFTNGDQTVTSPTTNCATKVTVTPLPVEKCKIHGKEQYDATDSKNCVAVLGATTLINTGPASLFGIFTVTAFAGAMLHNLFIVRRRI